MTRGPRWDPPARPCPRCPWSRDTQPGEFPLSRYRELAATVGRPGCEVHLDGGWFSCHKTPRGAERPCAGWLAAAGREHLGVRLRIATGELPASALDPGPGWPPLYTDYTELVAAMARPDTPDTPENREEQARRWHDQARAARDGRCPPPPEGGPPLDQHHVHDSTTTGNTPLHTALRDTPGHVFTADTADTAGTRASCVRCDHDAPVWPNRTVYLPHGTPCPGTPDRTDL